MGFPGLFVIHIPHSTGLRFAVSYYPTGSNTPTAAVATRTFSLFYISCTARLISLRSICLNLRNNVLFKDVFHRRRGEYLRLCLGTNLLLLLLFVAAYSHHRYEIKEISEPNLCRILIKRSN